jgi:RecA-family ATPase
MDRGHGNGHAGGEFVEVSNAANPAAAALGVRRYQYVGLKVPEALPTWQNRVFTAADLQHRVFPDPRMIVKGIVPEGLSLLGGRPKIGKSWLALDIGLAVASDADTCLGNKEVEHGAVLYLALEDTERRLQRRITRLIGANRTAWPERLAMATAWGRLDAGGLMAIGEWLAAATDPRLIILDTLAAVKPAASRNGGAYADDYGALAELHRLAGEYGVGVLVLHHQRKAEAADPVDTISGTLGLSGCSDTLLVLEGKTGVGTTLYVRGRDVEEAEYAVVFDRERCRWSIGGDAADVHRSDTRRKILEVLARVKPGTMSPSDIAGAAGLSDNAVKKGLGAMLAAGEVIKSGRGEYGHP